MDKAKIHEVLNKMNELAARIQTMKNLEARIGLGATLHAHVEEIETALTAEPVKAPPLAKVY